MRPLETLEPIWRYRLSAFCLILTAAALRLWYLIDDCPLDLAPDEAHYWDWSRHLDWSYYSKGPLVAWLIRLSCAWFGPWSLSLVGSEMVAVRLPAIICGSGLLVGLYVFTAQIVRRESVALVLVAIAVTLPLVAAGSTLMTIDAPYTCLWMWALVVAYRAVFGGNWWTWPTLGLLVGLGMLAKYTMVLFLPSLALFLWFTPGFRASLWRRGFWLAAVVALLGCMPIILWNAQHDWVTLRHAGSHAGVHSRQLVHLFGPLRYFGTQFGIMLGFWFVLWAVAVWRCRPGVERRPELLFGWWLSVPIFVFFALFSLKNGGGEPNWPVTAYLAGGVLAAAAFRDYLTASPPAQRRRAIAWCCGFTCIGLALTVVMHRIVWVQPVLARIAGPATPEGPTPMRRVDPTARLRGWRTLAQGVDRLRGELRERGVEPVLAAGSWNQPGELGFYCQGQPTVFNLGSAVGDRRSQYDLWRPNPVDDPQLFAGETFIVVGVREELLQRAFAEVEQVRMIVHEEQGTPVNRWIVAVVHGYHGFSRPAAHRGY